MSLSKTIRAYIRKKKGGKRKCVGVREYVRGDMVNMRTKAEIEKQLTDAEGDNAREHSPRTLGYIDALRWVLKKE